MHVTCPHRESTTTVSAQECVMSWP